MNGKQTIPPITVVGSILAAIPLPVLIGGAGIIALAAWWFSENKKAEKPLSGTENGNSGTKPLVPPLFSAPSDPAAPSVPPVSVREFPPELQNSARTGRLVAASPPDKQPSPAKQRRITREDLAAIFNGPRGLTRKAAVSVLNSLGFGRTAAYGALSSDGRFSTWLQYAPDGIITWKS